jgi:hypothetical protein
MDRIDGSKFKAVNHRDRKFTKKKMKTCLARLERHIARCLAELDEAVCRERALPQAYAVPEFAQTESSSSRPRVR